LVVVRELDMDAVLIQKYLNLMRLDPTAQLVNHNLKFIIFIKKV
jgi:hypothetical protein